MHLRRKVIFLLLFFISIVNASGAFYGLQYYYATQTQQRVVSVSKDMALTPSQRPSNISIATAPRVLDTDEYEGAGHAGSWPATYIPDSGIKGNRSWLSWNTDDEPFSHNDECVIRTQHSGVLRTYDDVLNAMRLSKQRGSKYQHFSPLIEVVRGVTMHQLKQIMYTIENIPEELSEDFADFCLAVISPLYEKARYGNPPRKK